ncbi:MAG: hypothetical protein IKP86_07435 [Anaerolineaceae bacterium]|nr:hypothetical protein [Anaerolineaceae bacterium]
MERGPDRILNFVLICFRKNRRESLPAFKVGNCGEENKRVTLYTCMG